MKFFYDTEFIDDGETLELISIGMVTENGEEYYAVNNELSLPRLLDEPWHMENTVPTLPVRRSPSGTLLLWDSKHKDWDNAKDPITIRDEIVEFIKSNTTKGDDVELWAWYGAYDQVILAQLWGPMVDLPTIIPHYTNDFKQELTRMEKLTGNKRLRFEMPLHRNTATLVPHNALDDARLLKLRYEWLEEQ